MNKKTALDYTNEAITRSNELRAGAPLTPQEELSKRLMDHLAAGNSTDDLQGIIDQWVKEQNDGIHEKLDSLSEKMDRMGHHIHNAAHTDTPVYPEWQFGLSQFRMEG